VSAKVARADRRYQSLRLLAGAGRAVGVAASPASAQGLAETGGLTPDQQAIIDKIAKPAVSEGPRYAGAPTDVIASEVSLPAGNGQFVTLVTTGSAL